MIRWAADLLLLAGLVAADRLVLRDWTADKPLLGSAAGYVALLCVLGLVGRTLLHLPFVGIAGFRLLLAGTLLDMLHLCGLCVAILVPYVWLPWPVWPAATGVAVGLALWLEHRESFGRGADHPFGKPRGPDAPAAEEREKLDALRAFARGHGEDPEQLNLVVLRGDVETALCFSACGKATIGMHERVLSDLSAGEREAVFAHELAHHRLDHSRISALTVRAGQAAAALVTAVALQVAWPSEASGPQAIKALSAVVLLWYVVRTALGPLVRVPARRQELQADRMAMQMTDAPAAFVSAMTWTARKSGADDGAAGPLHWLLDEGPTLAQKLALAERHASRQCPPSIGPAVTQENAKA